MQVNVSAQVEHLLRLAAEKEIRRGFIHTVVICLGSLRAFLETDCILMP